MNNASLYAADRATHLRVVAVGLFAPTVLLALMLGLTSRAEAPPIQSVRYIQELTIQAKASQHHRGQKVCTKANGHQAFFQHNV